VKGTILGFQFVLIQIVGFALVLFVNARLYGIALPLLALRYRQDAIVRIEGAPGGSVGLFESVSREFFEIGPQFVGRMSSATGSTLGVFLSPEVGAIWFSPLIAFALIGPILLVVLQRTGADIKLAILLGASVLGALAISTYWRGTGQGYGLRYWYGVVPIAFLALGRVTKLLNFSEKWPSIYANLGLAWVSFGIVGQFFYDAIPGFYKETVEPAFFGRPSGYVPGFAHKLLGALLTPQSWVLVAAARLPGWVLLVSAPKHLLVKLGELSILPVGLRYDTLDAIRIYDRVPMSHLSLGAAYVALSFSVLALLLAGFPHRRVRSEQ
jgi:hypothetical protein